MGSTVIDLGVDNVKGGYYIEVEFGVFSAASNLKVEIESVEIVLKGIQSFREIKDLNDEKDKILDFDVALNVKAYLGHIDVDDRSSSLSRCILKGQHVHWNRLATE